MRDLPAGCGIDALVAVNRNGAKVPIMALTLSVSGLFAALIRRGKRCCLRLNVMAIQVHAV